MPSEKIERFYYFINNRTAILKRRELISHLITTNFFGKITYVKRVFFADKKKDNKETVYIITSLKDLIRMFEIEDTLSFKI